jgi:hypothetical protein
MLKNKQHIIAKPKSLQTSRLLVEMLLEDYIK